MTVSNRRRDVAVDEHFGPAVAVYLYAFQYSDFNAGPRYGIRRHADVRKKV